MCLVNLIIEFLSGHGNRVCAPLNYMKLKSRVRTTTRIQSGLDLAWPKPDSIHIDRVSPLRDARVRLTADT